MSEKITVTRRSIVGFGYTSACEQVWNKDQTQSYLQVCETTEPVHTGTILKVLKAIGEDKTLRSYQGGTFYSTAWFVKVGGKFHKIITPHHETSFSFDMLAEKLDNRYISDEITVEIE